MLITVHKLSCACSEVLIIAYLQICDESHHTPHTTTRTASAGNRSDRNVHRCLPHHFSPPHHHHSSRYVIYRQAGWLAGHTKLCIFSLVHMSVSSLHSIKLCSLEHILIRSMSSFFVSPLSTIIISMWTAGLSETVCTVSVTPRHPVASTPNLLSCIDN